MIEPTTSKTHQLVKLGSTRPRTGSYIVFKHLKPGGKKKTIAFVSSLREAMKKLHTFTFTGNTGTYSIYNCRKLRIVGTWCVERKPPK